MGAGASAQWGSVPSDVTGGEIDLIVRAGRNLVAKDGGMFTKANSDPFVNVILGGNKVRAVGCMICTPTLALLQSATPTVPSSSALT